MRTIDNLDDKGLDGLDWRDVQAIHHVYHRFWLLHDLRRDVEAMDRLMDFGHDRGLPFLFDASALGVADRMVDRAGLERYFAVENVTVKQVIHLNANIIVDAVRDGIARGIAITYFRSNQAEAYVEGAFLSEDMFVRSDTGWRFRQRVMMPHGPAPRRGALGDYGWDGLGSAFAR